MFAKTVRAHTGPWAAAWGSVAWSVVRIVRMIRGSLEGEAGDLGDFDAGLGEMEGIRNSATEADRRAWRT